MDKTKFLRVAILPPNGTLMGHPIIETEADFLVLGPSSTDGKTYTTVHRDARIGLRVTRGCFSGSLDEFIALIPRFARDNLAMIAQAEHFVRQIREHFGVQP